MNIYNYLQMKPPRLEWFMTCSSDVYLLLMPPLQAYFLFGFLVGFAVGFLVGFLVGAFVGFLVGLRVGVFAGPDPDLELELDDED